MSDRDLHPLAADYLRRLRRAARRLPRGERDELCLEIEAHLLETTSAASPPEQVLKVLDRLGDPLDIVDAQRPLADARSDGRPIREWWAIALLLFGGFIFGLGWLVGLALLWSSRAWTTRDKWIGSLVLPGGLALVPIAALVASSTQICSTSAGVTRCTGGGGVSSNVLQLTILVVTVVAPILTAIHLWQGIRQASRPGRAIRPEYR